jgi:23S rRNA (guanine2445-N2)-methyltransferase / 23S rRNA (guanine2069-N7)-methyltransferase
MNFTATVSRGLEQALVSELSELGIDDLRVDNGAVHFAGGLDEGYRALLNSRVASRVLLALGHFRCGHAGQLYEGVHAINWVEHVDTSGTIAVDFVGRSESLHDSRFGARKVKDAVVDLLRDRTGERPSIDLKNPDVRINLHLSHEHATVGIDLSGHPLFRRGHGRDGGVAPLKETLAAGILNLAGWPAAAAEGRPLFDPMCGSGTFLTEAAAMATRKAPGLPRQRWGFSNWLGHDEAAWQRERERARDLVVPLVSEIRGADHDPEQVDRASENLARAGWYGKIAVEQGPLSEGKPWGDLPGLVVCNPPYGERLQPDDLVLLYREIGDVLRRRFLGWTGWILAGSPKLGRQFGLKPSQRISLFNGPIDCRLVQLSIRAAPVARDV